MKRHRLRSRRASVAVVLAALVLAVPVLAGGLASVGDVAPAAAANPVKAQGAGPLADILHWADVYKCKDLTRDSLAAMMLVPTYTETGADGLNTAASPMTLSRYDNQDALYAFKTKGFADKAFFHPGIGEWQWDSAGFWNLHAGTAIDTVTAAKQAADTISYYYCKSTSTNAAKRREFGWSPWYYCTSTDSNPSRCEVIYNQLLVDGELTVKSLPSISSTGGMQWRTCDITGIGVVACGFVDPAKAQGLNSFTVPKYGPAPLSAPFYVFEAGGKEYRYWLAADTGYTSTIRASKPITANARTSLTWQYSDTLCDRSVGRGMCQPTWSAVVGAGFTATPGGRTAMGRNLDGRLEAWAVGTDFKLYHNFQNTVNGSWYGWVSIGGVFPPGTSPVVGRNADGRLEVFGVAGDGTVWHAWQNAPNGGWSALYPMGLPANGPGTGTPVVGRNLDGRLEVFARGSDGRLWHSYQLRPSGSWSEWVRFDGATMADGTTAAVALNADGRQQVVIMKADGRLGSLSQVSPNGVWNGYNQLSGGPFVTTASPALGRNADGRLEVFLAGDVYGVVYHSWQTSPGGAFDGVFPFSIASSVTPVPVLDTAGKMNLFVVGAGGAIGVMRQIAPGSDWLPLKTIGGAAVTVPSVDLNQDTRLDLHSTTANGSVLHAWQLDAPS